jgi:serine O-acetyltransferase
MFPHVYDGTQVKQWVGNSHWRAWRADLARFKKHGYSGWGSEGFWALTLYRLQRALLPHRRRWWAVLPWLVLAVAKKLLTMFTHINLEARAQIGPGLLIPHSGPVRIHEDAVIGADCALHHVVTVGAGSRPGAARIGDHVMVGCHAAILGPVRIGDRAIIAASSLVVADVPADHTAVGVPARSVPNPEPARGPAASHASPDAPVAGLDGGSLADPVPAVIQGPPLQSSGITLYERLRLSAQARADAHALRHLPIGRPQ